MKSLKNLSENSKKKIGLFLKISVSLVLIFWVIVFKIDWAEFRRIFSSIRMPYLLMAFSLHIFGFWFSAWRWQKLLHTQDVQVKLMPLIDSYLVAAFFNTFMPSKFGGDVVRVSDLRKASGSVARSASFIIAERFLGVSVLFTFAFFASILQISLAEIIPAIWIALAFGFFGLLLLFSVLYFPLVDLLIKLIPFQKIREKLMFFWNNFRRSIRSILRNKYAWSWGLSISVLLQINVIIHYWLIGKSIGFQISLIDYFFLMPVLIVILVLPAINGIGLREASNIVVFGFYGTSATSAAMFGFIDLFMLLVIGVIGGFRFMIRKNYPEPGRLKSTRQPG